VRHPARNEPRNGVVKNNISFRRAVPSTARDALVAFDRAVFGTDAFYPEQWDDYEAYWMIMGVERVGCCAFKRDTDFRDDPDEDSPRLVGSLYLVSTGILPKYQGRGFGERFKRWQIAWARRNRFGQIVTNSRQSNRRIIALNEKLGFKFMWTTKGSYYDRPEEKAVAMKLILPHRGRRVGLRSAATSRIHEIVALLIDQRNRVDRAIDALAGR
jgi:ribosomal protein S18 acetylase RimI-like enzyme